MGFLTNLKVRNKLLLLLLFPIMSLLFFSLRGVMEKHQVQTSMAALETLSALAVKLSSVVHETQKERGMSMLFLGSKGVKFGDKLQSQRSNTDRAIAEMQTQLKGMETVRFDAGFKEHLNHALELLGMLQDRRSAVSALRL